MNIKIDITFKAVVATRLLAKWKVVAEIIPETK